MAILARVRPEMPAAAPSVFSKMASSSGECREVQAVLTPCESVLVCLAVLG